MDESKGFVNTSAISGKTPIGLNQWAPTDNLKMRDFNEDNSIIDSAITSLREDISNMQHNKDSERWDQVFRDAADILAMVLKNAEAISNLADRLSHVEYILHSAAASQQFSVNFDSLDGIAISRGIWNAIHHKIEC